LLASNDANLHGHNIKKKQFTWQQILMCNIGSPVLRCVRQSGGAACRGARPGGSVAHFDQVDALSYKRDVCESVPMTDLAADGENRADTLYSGTRKGVQFPRSFTT